MGTPSNLGRALAALRLRTTIHCEVCGAEKEVWLREKQMPRTCSSKCRQQLWRNTKRSVSVAQGRRKGAASTRPSESG